VRRINRLTLIVPGNEKRSRLHIRRTIDQGHLGLLGRFKTCSGIVDVFKQAARGLPEGSKSSKVRDCSSWGAAARGLSLKGLSDDCRESLE
jgi:hypothetical protein